MDQEREKKIAREKVSYALELSFWAVGCSEKKAGEIFAQEALKELKRVKDAAPYLDEEGELLSAVAGYTAVLLRERFGYELG